MNVFVSENASTGLKEVYFNKENIDIGNSDITVDEAYLRVEDINKDNLDEMKKDIIDDIDEKTKDVDFEITLDDKEEISDLEYLKDHTDTISFDDCITLKDLIPKKESE